MSSVLAQPRFEFVDPQDEAQGVHWVDVNAGVDVVLEDIGGAWAGEFGDYWAEISENQGPAEFSLAGPHGQVEWIAFQDTLSGQTPEKPFGKWQMGGYTIEYLAAFGLGMFVSYELLRRLRRVWFPNW